jgi:DNA replication protein
MNVKDLLMEKKFIVGKHLIKEAVKLGLGIDEFLLLLYFENSDTNIFDVELIKKNMGISEEIIMNSFNKLMSKKLISFETGKDSEGRIFDGISLNNFYELIEKDNKEENNNSDTIFMSFENEFARTLSPSEYEYINRFLEIGFSEELILGALKEAVYNGATNMRYIDTVLHEWKKKGYKTMDDVKNNIIKKETEKNEEIFDFDWLNDDEE